MTDFVVDTEHPVSIPCEGVHLEGLLHIPQHATGLIIFVHGSCSSRLSPRNQLVARLLQQAHFATLLFDLLTPEEDEIDNKTMEFRFDIDLLAVRLIAATRWAKACPILHTTPLGYFGASTGGAAALIAAAQESDLVRAVVSRGGRPDLAEISLPDVKAATLLVVGGNDGQVIEMNKKAFTLLNCEKKLEIVPEASHLFEEPGKLEEVARLAEAWFKEYL